MCVRIMKCPIEIPTSGWQHWKTFSIVTQSIYNGHILLLHKTKVINQIKPVLWNSFLSLQLKSWTLYWPKQATMKADLHLTYPSDIQTKERLWVKAVDHQFLEITVRWKKYFLLCIISCLLEMSWNIAICHKVNECLIKQY